MIEMVKSNRPVWHTFHRAWSACVGLRKYDKAAWRRLEVQADEAERSSDPKLTEALLVAIEALLAEQGGVYSNT